MTYNPTIAYHAKHELRGWSEVCRYPADWAGWHTFDKSMIEVFANDRQAAVAWHEYKPENLNVSLFSKGDDLVVKRVTAWKMKSIYESTRAQ